MRLAGCPTTSGLRFVARLKSVTFRADPLLLERLAVECERRGVSKTAAFEAGLLLWLEGGPVSARDRQRLKHRKVRVSRGWL